MTSQAIAFSFPINPSFSTVLPFMLINSLSIFNKLDRDLIILSRYFETFGFHKLNLYLNY